MEKLIKTKKSIFERIIYDLPEWLVSGLVYAIGVPLMILVMFGLPSCAPFEPIPGLCYTDKTGTYICMDSEEHKEVIEQRKITAKERCRAWIGTDWWFECMNNEN